jgi:transcriptional regulator with XRE-family HTH domain
MTLSEFIVNYRKEHGLSQRRLSDQCGLSTGYISLIEKEINPQTGKKMVPTLAALNKLATGMGMTIDDLFQAVDDMPVSISDKTALVDEDGLDETEAEIFAIVTNLSPQKKTEALGYLRYLEARKDT